MTRIDRQARRHFFKTLAALPLLAALALAPEGAQAQWATSGNDINNTNTGNVGIGTATPLYKLDVRTAGPKTDTTQHVIMTGGSDEITNPFLFTVQWWGAASLSGRRVELQTSERNVADGGNLVLQPRAGNVGIGTTSPTRPLEVLAANGEAARLYRNGNGAAYGVNIKFALNNSAGTQVDYAGVHGQIGSSTAGAEKGNLLFTTVNAGTLTERMRIDGNGNVGVGTTNPNYRMVVGPEMQSGLIYAAMTVSKGANTSSSVVVGAGGLNNAEFGWDHPNARAFFNAPGTSTMAFVQNGSNVRMFINNVGNIGIANSIIPLDAANKLTVDGNVHVTGNISAKYQDVAEWVPSRERLAAGTVVVLDTTASNHVVASTTAYDTGVAGVVSEQPGIILGEAGAGKVKVATTGRVKVRVDATRAPVRIGDLLVTGDSPGVAMRSEPVTVGGRRLHAPGTIVGKALEPLEKGVGEILVLLSLQ